MKSLNTVICVVAIGLAGATAYWIQNRPAATANANVPNAPGTGAPGVAWSGRGVGQGPGSGGGDPASIEVGRVEVMSLQDQTQAVGSLRSRQGVILRPEVGGRIAELGFVDGQRVTRGQLLVRLDDSLQQAQLLQAKAQASIARSNLQRNRELVAQNFVSESAVDQTAAALEVAQAQVAVAQAQLARMAILAPFDGVTGIRSVNIGDYVKDGADLVSVEDIGAMTVDFRLPEAVVSRLRLQQVVDVSLDGLPGRKFKARVEAIDSQLDANGRSLLVRARLDNSSGVLRSGMFARARIVFEDRPRALVIPEEALVPQGAKQFVIKVVDGTNGKVSQRIEPRLGLRVPGKVEVLQGLAAGDTIVTAGQARLMGADGVALRIVEVGVAESAPPPAEEPTRPLASATSALTISRAASAVQRLAN
ncbi:MAG: efflux RND transporter periplasmic adaptor subunit [Burkholderiales bacterium]|jgi:membrane fusion protein (multidrug efflux system)|nr:efflux RND transporter periplasmic adaptor subunit [Burkholderiales bacterium]